MVTLMRKSAGERGFTLIEVGICIVIISITAVGMYNAIILVSGFINDTRRVTKATNIARAMLERLADDPTSTDFYPTELYSQDSGLPNMDWQVEYLYGNGEEVLYSQIETTDPLTIRVTVFWQENQNSRERSVKLSTRITQQLI